MNILHVATTDGRDKALHAAAPGDTAAVCGKPRITVLDEFWPGPAGATICPRCKQAVAVLRQVSAV